MTQIRKFEGTVEAVADKNDKDYYGVCINEEWFNGEDSLPIDLRKGDRVKMAVNNSEDFIDVEAIKKIQGSEGNTQNEKVSSRSAGGSSGPNHLTKDQRINLKVAHKSAVEQLDRRETESEDDYREMLTKLTKLHLKSLEEVEEWMQE